MKTTTKQARNKSVATMAGRNGGTLKRGNTKNLTGRPAKIPELEMLMAEVLAEEANGMEAAKRILRALVQRAVKGDVRAAEVC